MDKVNLPDNKNASPVSYKQLRILSSPLSFVYRISSMEERICKKVG